MEKSGTLRRAREALTPLARDVGFRKGRSADDVLEIIVADMCFGHVRKTNKGDHDKESLTVQKKFELCGTTIFENIQESINFLNKHISHVAANQARQVLLSAVLSDEISTTRFKRVFDGVRDSSVFEARKRRALAMEAPDPRRCMVRRNNVCSDLLPDDKKCLPCGVYISFLCLRFERTCYVPDGFMTRFPRKDILR